MHLLHFIECRESRIPTLITSKKTKQVIIVNTKSSHPIETTKAVTNLKEIKVNNIKGYREFELKSQEPAICCQRKSAVALVKNVKEVFIQDCCNKGQRFNSTPLKQKVGEFLSTGVSWKKRT